MLIIIYGLPGVGKTFAGRVLAQEFGFHFWDGDNAVDQKLADCIFNKGSITQEMIDTLTDTLIKNIIILQKIIGEKHLVVSQALFRTKNREAISKKFPDAIFIHLQSENQIILERLNKRGGGYDETYLIGLAKNFMSSPYSEKNMSLKNNQGKAELIENLSMALKLQPLKINLEFPNEPLYPIKLQLNALGDKLTSEFKNNKLVCDNFTCIDNAEHKIVFCESFLNAKIEHFFTVHIEEASPRVFMALRVSVTSPNAHLMEWLKETPLDRKEDLRVCILSNTNEAYLYFRNNTIQVINYKTSQEIVAIIIALAIKSRNKLSYRREDVLKIRDDSKRITEYYEKFFHSNALLKFLNPPVKVSRHLIKTIYSNRKPLEKNTFVLGTLYKQANSEKVPTIMYFPGTAYMRELDVLSEEDAYKIALSTGCNVFVIHYRLAPEKLFPQALLDCVSAYEYLSDNSVTLNINPHNIILSGYSSGSTLALQLGILASSIENFKPPVSIVLVFPTLDFAYLNFPGNPFGNKDRLLTGDFFRQKQEAYFIKSKNKTLENPVISPLFLGPDQLKTLPRTFLLSGENDPMLPQHQKFAVMVSQYGANVENLTLPSVDHIAWWDNQLVVDSFSAWIRKNHFIPRNRLWNDAITHDKQKVIDHLPITKFTATDRLPFSELSLEQKSILNQFYRDFLLQRDELALILKEADDDVSCIPLQIYAATVHILSQSQKGIDAGERYFKRVEGKISFCERERMLVEALNFGRKNDLIKAIEKYTEILLKWPDDILSGLMVEFHCFEAGCPEKQLEAWEKIKGHYINKHALIDHPHSEHFLTSLGYAFELVGQPKKTLYYAGLAQSLNPINPWAQHALAHAFGALNNVDLGITLLNNYKDTWNLYGDFVKNHNYFHLTLFYLQKNEFHIAFNLYQTHIKREFPDHIYQQTDIIVFLWRANLCVNLPDDFKKTISNDFINLYKHINKTNSEFLTQRHLFPFLSLTYLYLCLGSGNIDLARTIEANLFNPEYANLERKEWEIGKNLAKGLILFSEGKYKEAYKLLKVNHALTQIGGSDEQRSVLNITYDIACERHRALQIKSKRSIFAIEAPKPGSKITDEDAEKLLRN